MKMSAAVAAVAAAQQCAGLVSRGFVRGLVRVWCGRAGRVTGARCVQCLAAKRGCEYASLQCLCCGAGSRGDVVGCARVVRRVV